MLENDKLEQKKRSSTAYAFTSSQLTSAMNTLDIIKAKSATLSRKQASQIQQQQQQQHQQQQQNNKITSFQSSNRPTVSKYKHQIGYKKSVTLSLFNSKWDVLRNRGGSSMTSRSLKLSKALELDAECKNNENLRLLVQLFWICICLLGVFSIDITRLFLKIFTAKIEN